MYHVRISDADPVDWGDVGVSVIHLHGISDDEFKTIIRVMIIAV